jgi:hypothetical protein
MTAEPEVQTTPEVLEQGRYKIFDQGGGWLISRAVDTCETCRNCGCGTQADPIQVPGMLIAMARQGGGLARLREGLKGLTGRG